MRQVPLMQGPPNCKHTCEQRTVRTVQIVRIDHFLEIVERVRTLFGGACLMALGSYKLWHFSIHWLHFSTHYLCCSNYKPYQNKIICCNNFICYSLNLVVFRCFCWVSQIKSEMIMSKLWIRISSWFVVPFFGIRIKWVYGFCCFVFSAFIKEISKRRFVERWNASHNRYKFWIRNH